MKSIKSLASVASLALVINFSSVVNGHSDILNHKQIVYAHSYSERSSKENYTKFKFKYNRGTLRSIKGVKINGVEYEKVSEGKDIKEGYYSGNLWGVHKGKELFIQPKVSKKDKVEFLINNEWKVSNKNIQTDSSSGATPEDKDDCDKYPAELPKEKIVVDNIDSLSYEEEDYIISVIKELNPHYDEVRMSSLGDRVKITYRDGSYNYIKFSDILREKQDCDRYPFVKPSKTFVEDINNIGRYRSAITQNVKSANPYVSRLDFGNYKNIKIVYDDGSYIIVDINDLVTLKTENDNQYDKLQKEIEKLKKQLAEKEAEIERLQGELADAKRSAQESKDALAQSKTEAEQAHKEALAAKKKAEEANKSLKAAQEEAEEAKRQAEAAKNNASLSEKEKKAAEAKALEAQAEAETAKLEANKAEINAQLKIAEANSKASNW